MAFGPHSLPAPYSLVFSCVTFTGLWPRSSNRVLLLSFNISRNFLHLELKFCPPHFSKEAVLYHSSNVLPPSPPGRESGACGRATGSRLPLYDRRNQMHEH